jgi:hypothetical protein
MKNNVPWVRKWRPLLQNRWVMAFTLISLTASLLTCNNAYAQQGTRPQILHGKVTNEAGKPLPDVSVKIKGINKGVVTNENGDYTIEIPEKSSKTLEFSYVGMVMREAQIGALTEMNMSLTSAGAEQEEVVVIGYGTQKKQAITGSVAQWKLRHLI